MSWCSCICACTVSSHRWTLVYDVLWLEWLVMGLRCCEVSLGCWIGFLPYGLAHLSVAGMLKRRPPLPLIYSICLGLLLLSPNNSAERTTTTTTRTSIHHLLSDGSYPTILIPTFSFPIPHVMTSGRHGFSSQRFVGIGFSCLARGRASERAGGC